MAGVEPKKGKSGEEDEINEWRLHDTEKSVAEMALKFPNFDFLLSLVKLSRLKY